MSAIKTRTARIDLVEDRIVVARLGDGVQTVDDARENLDACVRLAAPDRKALLVDIRAARPLLPEVRHQYMGERLDSFVRGDGPDGPRQPTRAHDGQHLSQDRPARDPDPDLHAGAQGAGMAARKKVKPPARGAGKGRVRKIVRALEGMIDGDLERQLPISRAQATSWTRSATA